MDLRHRVMTFLQRLRDPYAKPEYVEQLEQRQQEVARRIDEARRKYLEYHLRGHK